ncbi:MAG: CPBP family intramembrane glutamic endopeptidase, partial [Bacteroidota bacterium]
MPTSHPKYKLLKSRWRHLGLLLLAGLLMGRWIGVVVFTLTTMLGYEVALQSRLFMMQSAVSTSTLIVAPLVYWCWVEEQPLHCLFLFPNRHLIPALITLGLVLAFMVVNTWFVEWNRTVQLPSWLSGFEAWARNQEEEQQQLLALLTTFPTLRVLLTGLFVMGIIPAVGEELLFRGIIQSLLYYHWRNVHMAIGVSAFVFSAIHCQLYGLVPRWLLGILFGYVYWWTKDLRFPILA